MHVSPVRRTCRARALGLWTRIVRNNSKLSKAQSLVPICCRLTPVYEQVVTCQFGPRHGRCQCTPRKSANNYGTRCRSLVTNANTLIEEIVRVAEVFEEDLHGIVLVIGAWKRVEKPPPERLASTSGCRASPTAVTL